MFVKRKIEKTNKIHPKSAKKTFFCKRESMIQSICINAAQKMLAARLARQLALAEDNPNARRLENFIQMGLANLFL